MHYFSKSVRMSFEEATVALRQALKHHHLEILAEIDLGHALRRHLAVDFRPYLILSACSLRLAHRAIEASDNIGSILFCNVVVQLHEKATINHVDLMWTARELRSLVQQAIDDVENFAKSRHPSRHCEVAGRPLAHAYPRQTGV